MTGKDIAKLGAALAIVALAIVLFVVRTRSDNDADESTTDWWCSKTQKSFQLHGEENSEKVRTTRQVIKQTEASGEPRLLRPTEGVFTYAFSPYTKEWTGVPAMKCGGCGEVFPLEIEGAKENMCPKCQWNPATGKIGASTPAKDETPPS